MYLPVSPEFAHVFQGLQHISLPSRKRTEPPRGYRLGCQLAAGKEPPEQERMADELEVSHAVVEGLELHLLGPWLVLAGLGSVAASLDVLPREPVLQPLEEEPVGLGVQGIAFV